MFPIDDLNRINEDYLEAALSWLRIRLQALVGDAIPEEEVQAAATALHKYTQIETPPPLLTLSQQLGLSDFERDLLLLCVGVELDPQIFGLCIKANGNDNLPYPTFALALRLFDSPAWDAFSPERPLLYWRLIEINNRGNHPLTFSPLRIDTRIANYIKGFNHLDERLEPLLVPLTVPDQQIGLAASQQALVEQTILHLRLKSSQRSSPVLQLLGIHSESKKVIAWHLANAMGLTVYYLPVTIIPQRLGELDLLIRLWQRESMLTPVALYIDAFQLDETYQGLLPYIQRFLSRGIGRFIIDSRDVQNWLGRETINVDIAKPTTGEQRSVWLESLGVEYAAMAIDLSSQFNLELWKIREITSSVQPATSGSDAKEYVQNVWQTCLIQLRPHLDTLAQRIDPRAQWNDIVLPEDAMDILYQIANQVSHRGRVYEDWGFKRRLNRGLGVIALFTGESGTGKTMAAEVIANELKLNLYRIDLSAVVSKYIGETEKNLRRLFDAAEDGGCILFFDEADALFGKRSNVKDSHDRYANIETNYLLQRIEAFHGLAILATNMKSNMDEAFTRRIRFIVDFPFPQLESRKRIWQGIFPPETPLDQLDYDRLADFKMAGGSIANIAINAAFLAANENTIVGMPHVLHALRLEFRKSERLIDEQSFQ